MNTNREMTLPVGWTNTILGNVLFESDEKFDPKDGVKKKYVGLEHIEKHAGVLNGYGNSGETLSTKNIFGKGDLLYGKLRPYLNKVVVVDFDGVCSTDILVFKKNDFTSTQFLKYRLLCRDFVSYAQTNVSGVQHPRVNLNTIKEFFLNLPPLAEQHRIVAKIEELFSDLDAGIASLKQAQAQLKTYRQAVLKYAFEGKLTAAWREQNKPEPAEKLLAQIKVGATRRVAPTKRHGKSKKPKEFPPLTEAELAELPELPEGWCWMKLGNLSMGVEYGSAKKSKEEGKIPVIRMGNLQNGVIVWDDLVYTDDEDEINQYFLRKDDVLFNRTNSPELVGKTAIYKGERPAIFAGYLIRINQVSDVDARYLNYFLNCHIAKNHGNRVKTDGVNQSNINGEKLGHYPFPLVSKEEQHQIVQEIESRLSVCDKLEESIKESLQKAEALRQSILKKAFEGKLVPQDPNDEPAEKLLERIRAERAQLEQNTNAKKK